MIKYEDAKQCPKCGLFKIGTKFTKNQQRLDGKCFYCKQCVKDSTQNRNQKEAQPILLEAASPVNNEVKEIPVEEKKELPNTDYKQAETLILKMFDAGWTYRNLARRLTDMGYTAQEGGPVRSETLRSFITAKKRRPKRNFFASRTLNETLPELKLGAVLKIPLGLIKEKEGASDEEKRKALARLKLFNITVDNQLNGIDREIITEIIKQYKLGVSIRRIATIVNLPKYRPTTIHNIIQAFKEGMIK